MATGPDLRIGDADREAAAASLREHYAEGRLTLEEFNQRLDAAFAATTQSELYRVISDLPHVNTPSRPLPVTAAGGYRERSRHEYRQRSRPRLRFVSAFVTVFVAWLLVVSLFLPDFRHFPLPGKLGILVAIFAVIRGLLRRITGGRGGCGRRRW